MKEIKGGVIAFLGYRLARFEYTCSPSFNLADIENGKMQFNLSKVGSPLEDGRIQISLLTRVFYSADESIQNAPLKIIVEIAGLFKVASGGPWDPKWDSNAVAIMYPYVRALVGSLTAQSGREPILLPTVNAAAMFDEAGSQGAEQPAITD